MIKKIGLLNFHHSDRNYGAVLQAAALASKLELLGYEVEHLNFIPKGKKSGIVNRLRRQLGNLFRALGLKKKVLVHENIKNSRAFENFRNKWIKRSEKTFLYSQDIKITKEDYSAIIVGSDQVWRPHYTKENCLTYFLDFVPKDIKRISYAASFGTDEWDESVELTAKISDELKKFNAVSTRETSGVKLCQNIFSINATHVLDPTLLVEKSFFDTIIADHTVSERSDIVYYKLDIDNNFVNGIKKISLDNNYSNENIFYSNKNGILSYSEVSDWLFKIKHSEIVVTDSFHCICFAIIFRKKFIYYPNIARGMTRIESLLDMLELKDRICLNPEMLNNKCFTEKEIDYQSVHSILNSHRILSTKYLTDALAK